MVLTIRAGRTVCGKCCWFLDSQSGNYKPIQSVSSLAKTAQLTKETVVFKIKRCVFHWRFYSGVTFNVCF